MGCYSPYDVVDVDVDLSIYLYRVTHLSQNQSLMVTHPHKTCKGAQNKLQGIHNSGKCNMKATYIVTYIHT